MSEILGTVNKGLDFAENSFESKGELRKMAFDAHTADMLSDNKLSKLVRPLTHLTLLYAKVLEFIVSMFGLNLKAELSEQLSYLLGVSMIFYFGSKALERQQEKKSFAEIKMNNDRNEAILKEKKILLNQEVKDREQERKVEFKEAKVEIRNKRKPLFRRNKD